MKWPEAFARLCECAFLAVFFFSIANCAGRCCEANSMERRPVIINQESKP